MRTRVLYLSHDKGDPLLAQAEDYLRRAGRELDAELVHLKPGKRTKGADDAKIQQAEGELLLSASEGCTRIALDAAGRKYTSEDFSKTLDAMRGRGKPLAFLIGGATGLSDEVRSQADALWSLSPLTFPHRLAVCVLCEQLYRAMEIRRGGPYHK